MELLLKIKCVDSRVNLHILVAASVSFTLSTVQVPNLALTHMKRITVYLRFCWCENRAGSKKTDLNGAGSIARLGTATMRSELVTNSAASTAKPARYPFSLRTQNYGYKYSQSLQNPSHYN
jgi:hypothetical protein